MQDDEDQARDNQANDGNLTLRPYEPIDEASSRSESTEKSDIPTTPALEMAPEEIEPPSGYATHQTALEESDETASDQPELTNIPDEPTYRQPETIAKKPRRKRLMVVSAAVVLVLLIGGTASAYKFWYQNPDKVVGDALTNALVAETATYKSTFDITTKNDSSSDAEHIVMQLDGKYNQSAGEIKLTATVPLDGQSVTFSGTGIYDKDSNLFIKLTNLQEIAKLLNQEMASVPSIQALLKTYDDTWVKLNADSQKSVDKSTDGTSNCLQTALDKLSSDTSIKNELADAYKANRFIVVKENLSAKNGNLGYVLGIDDDKATSFNKALKDTTFYKEVNTCDNTIFSDIDSSTNKTSDNATVTVWIDRWSHQLSALDVDFNNDSSSIIMSAEPTFDTEVTITSPQNAVTLQDFMDDYQKAQLQYYKAQYSKVGSKAAVSTSVDYSSSL